MGRDSARAQGGGRCVAACWQHLPGPWLSLARCCHLEPCLSPSQGPGQHLYGLLVLVTSFDTRVQYLWMDLSCKCVGFTLWMWDGRRKRVGTLMLNYQRGRETEWVCMGGIKVKEESWCRATLCCASRLQCSAALCCILWCHAVPCIGAPGHCAPILGCWMGAVGFGR